MDRDKNTKDEILAELKELQKLFSETSSKYEIEISQLRQTEKELLKSEEKFRKAFVTSPDSININRFEDGMYISINKGFTKVTGYSEEDVIGKTSLELNIWKDPSDRKKLIEGLMTYGEVENLEATFVTKTGEEKFGIMSAAIINLEDVKHILSVTRDITERKVAAMALQESENRYRELIELAVDGILHGSTDGTIIGANTCIVNLSGRSLDKLLGTHVSVLFDQEELKSIPLRFDLLKKGEVVIFEREILRPDGKKVPVEMHTKMMPDGTYQSIFHDITERREAVMALRESEEWFRNLFEESKDGILYLNLDGKIVAVNRTFAEMHGYTLHEMQKMNISDLDCPDTKKLYAERMQRLKKGVSLKFEVDHFHKNGSCIPLEVNAGIISMGLKDYIIASHRDITERKKVDEAMRIAMEKAEAGDRLKSSFLNNISHEVRTPLNGIIGFAEILSKDTLDAAEKDKALKIVNECSERLLDTITNYMDISLLVSGEMSMYKREFKVRDLLFMLIGKFEIPCASKGLKFRIDIDELPEYEVVNSDPELIGKALSHLLNNAIKFTEEGFITFGCKLIEGDIIFQVSDTGIGIGKESIDNIFNHFVKEDQNRSRSSEGSGLGLSISRGIAELLGGSLKAESEKGKGSSFSLTIPVSERVKVIRKAGDAKKGDLNRKLTSILVAEDDGVNFLFIKTLLSKITEARIIHAINGREAIEKFKNNPDVDIILMDMKMPEIDGFEATRKIKSINPEIPIIAITAYAMLGDENRILDAGCDEYLCKPISKTLLFEKISKYVSV